MRREQSYTAKDRSPAAVFIGWSQTVGVTRLAVLSETDKKKTIYLNEAVVSIIEDFTKLLPTPNLWIVLYISNIWVKRRLGKKIE